MYIKLYKFEEGDLVFADIRGGAGRLSLFLLPIELANNSFISVCSLSPVK